jgi:hypothetical protein
MEYENFKERLKEMWDRGERGEDLSKFTEPELQRVKETILKIYKKVPNPTKELIEKLEKELEEADNDGKKEIIYDIIDNKMSSIKGFDNSKIKKLISNYPEILREIYEENKNVL